MSRSGRRKLAALRFSQRRDIMFKLVIACLLMLFCCAMLAGCTNEDDSSENSSGGESSSGGMNIHEMWTDEP